MSSYVAPRLESVMYQACNQGVVGYRKALKTAVPKTSWTCTSRSMPSRLLKVTAMRKPCAMDLLCVSWSISACSNACSSHFRRLPEFGTLKQEEADQWVAGY